MNRAIYFALGIVLLSLVSLSSISVVYVYGQQTTPPWNIILVSPNNGGTVTSSPINLQVKVTTTSSALNTGATVGFYVDGVLIGSSTIVSGYASFSFAPMNYGLHYLYIRAFEITSASPLTEGHYGYPTLANGQCYLISNIQSYSPLWSFAYTPAYYIGPSLSPNGSIPPSYYYPPSYYPTYYSTYGPTGSVTNYPPSNYPLPYYPPPYYPPYYDPPYYP